MNDNDNANSEHPIKQALTLTAHTFDRRTRWYRNLVIVVVGLPALCIVTAAVTMRWHPLAGILFLVPLCCLFFCFDAFLVRKWQKFVLALWAQGELDLGGFVQAVSAIRTIPEKTLRGLLAVVPGECDLPPERILETAIRKTVAKTCGVLQRCQLDRAAGICLATTAIAGAIVSWPVSGKVAVLSGFVFGALVMPVVRFLAVMRFKRLLLSCMGNPSFQVKPYLDIVACLDWRGVSHQRKSRFLKALTAKGRISGANDETGN